jgi:hypothetical protein
VPDGVIWTDSPVLEVDVERSMLGEDLVQFIDFGENLVHLIDVVGARSVQ